MSIEPSDAPTGPSKPWRGVHRALADPLRIRLFEALWHGPRSAKDLADAVGLPPDRLYYHLRQLEQARIIEVGGYRPLPSGRVERVYRRVEAEPPQDAASPDEVAAFLGSVLDATSADITAAFMAKEAGRRREVYVGRGPLRLTDEGLAELQAYLGDLERRFADPSGDGTWVSALVALVDLEDRPPVPRGQTHGARRTGPKNIGDE
jgi:DNA-binding transcriptional ArsR family regulator